MSDPVHHEAVTEGHRLFDKWLASHGQKNAHVADVLGVNRATVGGWRAETARGTPEIGARRAIEILTGGEVPATSWETDTERAIVARAKEAAKSEKKAKRSARAA